MTIRQTWVPAYIVITLLAVSVAYSTQAQPYNVQPCYQFWSLTDQLRSGIKPSTQAWDSLRRADGYRRKSISDKAWRTFIDQVTLVYSPGNEAVTENKQKTDLALQWIARYAREESKLKQYVTQLQGNPAMDSATAYVRQWLPTPWKHRLPQPRVDLVLYDYDGSASDYGITMDLLAFYDTEQIKPGSYLGHELLHYALAYYRVKARRFKYVPPKHQAVFNALNGISEEGIADLIDKPFLLFNNASGWLLQDTVMTIYTNQSKAFVHRLNEGLEKLADGAREPYSTSVYWKSATMPDHIPGLYMGRLIQQGGLTNKLVEQVDNPFAFYRLYNQAVRHGSTHDPVLSKKAISFIRWLERKYR
jgi:hypothetical protein